MILSISYARRAFGSELRANKKKAIDAAPSTTADDEKRRPVTATTRPAKAPTAKTNMVHTFAAAEFAPKLGFAPRLGM